MKSSRSLRQKLLRIQLDTLVERSSRDISSRLPNEKCNLNAVVCRKFMKSRCSKIRVPKWPFVFLRNEIRDLENQEILLLDLGFKMKIAFLFQYFTFPF